jgi:cytidylate kinase
MDTGLLYRAVGLNLWRFGGDPESEFAAVRACDFSQTDFDDPELKSEAVGGIASRISAYPQVRAALIARQQAFARQDGGAVLDGRDIGTIIAPEAEAKLFVTASAQVRARRRFDELARMGKQAHFDDVLIDIQARDARDSGRAAAPLRMAGDAIRIDTSDLGIVEATAEAIAAVERRIAAG